MKIHFRAALLLLTAALLGCDKPDEGLVVEQTEAPIGSLAEFHRLFAPPQQIIHISTSQAQNVPLADGSVVFVPAQAFALPNGTTAQGTIELRARAVTQPINMLLGGLPTMSFWRPLESGGQAHFTAWLNGVPLHLRLGFSLTLSLPQQSTASLSGMGMWKGFPVTGSVLTWVQDSARVRLDGIPGGQQYYQAQLRTDSLGWFNVGQLWTSSPADTTQLRADVAGDAAARVYVLPTRRSGIFMLKWNTQTRLMELYGVPAGSEVKVFALRAEGGKILVGAERVTLRRGYVFRRPLTPMSAQAAADFIRQF